LSKMGPTTTPARKMKKPWMVPIQDMEEAE
jgi:hypothetical protein